MNVPTTSRRVILLCGIGPAIIAAVLALSRPAFLTNLDNVVYDGFLRFDHKKPPSSRIVIVEVDERSLAAHGQWPWPRDLMARLVGRLQDLGASSINLDIIFAESDRVRGTDEGASQSPTDAVLAETLRQGRVVMGYALQFDTAARADGCVMHPLGLTIVQTSDEPVTPFFRATGGVCSLPNLVRAAGASGFLNAAPDADGILRRAPLLLELDSHVYPGLALAAVMAATGAHSNALRVSNANTVSLILDNQTVVPLDGKSNLLLRYRGKKRTFPYVSAADVLDKPLPGGAFDEKIVFVGTTALGTREVVSTPLDTLFAGVEVQATVADNLLQQDFIRRHEWGALLESQVTVALGVAIAMVVVWTGTLWGALVGAAGLVALWGGAVGLFWTYGLFVSPVSPTLGSVSALAALTLAKSAAERRRAEMAGLEKTIAQRFMVQSLLSLTEMRDVETGRHSRRTQLFTRLLAEELSTQPAFHDYLTSEQIQLLSSLAPLHDIGKVGVPDHILNKPGRYTEEERVEMQKHPAHGRDVILNSEHRVGVYDDTILSLAKEIVYTHHEWWNGGGYPEGLRGSQIPIPGRVMAVVDVYDAMSSRRVYHSPMSHDESVDFIVARKGTHFDPDVVDAFVRVAPAFRDAGRDLLEVTAGAPRHSSYAGADLGGETVPELSRSSEARSEASTEGASPRAAP
ncbi:MAG: CHASE2 domain-containing protein [Planctomycetota bacterium]|nr:CHASE2 domain-containing protein [Planctomycetota bacterium]